MRRRFGVIAALIALAATFLASDYVLRFNQNYAPSHAALAHALANNDFGFAYANQEDLKFFAREFAWLERQPTETKRVVELVDWLNKNLKEEEVLSVRARDLYEARSAACEVHALAVAILRSIGITARWISTVKMARGFGLLEAFVDGQWQLFSLRRDKIALNKSAWELYQSSEPGLSIRFFYSLPEQNTRSFAGSVHPSLFLAHNANERPEMQVIFHSIEGLDIAADTLDDHELLVGFRNEAEEVWVDEGVVSDKYRWIRRQSFNRRAGRLAWVLRRVGLASADDEPMLTTP